MTDLALTFDTTLNAGDLCLADGDLALDHGLRSLVLSSLMTDARAEVSEVDPRETDRRGWWGDALEAQGVRGGKLWLLERMKALPENLRRAEDYAHASLAWMIADGIVAAIRVVALRRDIAAGASQIRLEIEIDRPTGDAVSLLYDLLWRQT